MLRGVSVRDASLASVVPELGRAPSRPRFRLPPRRPRRDPRLRSVIGSPRSTRSDSRSGSCRARSMPPLRQRPASAALRDVGGCHHDSGYGSRGSRRVALRRRGDVARRCPLDRVPSSRGGCHDGCFVTAFATKGTAALAHCSCRTAFSRAWRAARSSLGVSVGDDDRTGGGAGGGTTFTAGSSAGAVGSVANADADAASTSAVKLVARLTDRIIAADLPLEPAPLHSSVMSPMDRAPE